MPEQSPYYVLFNPAAGRGRGKKRIHSYLSLLKQHLGDFEYAETERPGHEVELVDDAIERGYASIIAIGGDGTWSVVADRIVRSGRDVTLGMLPAGTGCDFGKSIGVRHEDADRVVRTIADGITRTIDVGRVEDRHFLNVVGLGFDIAVIDDAEDFPILKGDLLYQFCALRQLFSFTGLPISLAADDASVRPVDHLLLVVSNANYFGGSFHIAPQASLEDGKLDATSILNAGPLERARLFSKVGKGKHQGEDKVVIQQAATFTVELPQPVRYEVDGEVYTSRSKRLRIESVPQALKVFAPVNGER